MLVSHIVESSLYLKWLYILCSNLLNLLFLNSCCLFLFWLGFCLTGVVVSGPSVGVSDPGRDGHSSRSAVSALLSEPSILGSTNPVFVHIVARALLTAPPSCSGAGTCDFFEVTPFGCATHDGLGSFAGALKWACKFEPHDLHSFVGFSESRVF